MQEYVGFVFEQNNLESPPVDTASSNITSNNPIKKQLTEHKGKIQ